MKINKEGNKKSWKPDSIPFLVFRRDHLRSTSGIICGSGSFAVQFGDHFRCGDHLRSGIICGAVQFSCLSTNRRRMDIWKIRWRFGRENFCIFHSRSSVALWLYHEFSNETGWRLCGHISQVRWGNTWSEVVRTLIIMVMSQWTWYVRNN